MKRSIGIIGSGPTALYVLKNIADNRSLISTVITTIYITEKQAHAGIGMPYSEKYTELCNMSNISSEEIPLLSQSLASWLKEQPEEALKGLEIDTDKISETIVYPRLVLGQYFKNEYEYYKSLLENANIKVVELCNAEVIDIIASETIQEFELVIKDKDSITCNNVIIASGHEWIYEDNTQIGYFASPWPITKVLPEKGTYDNYTVGILGASLSAFDVVSSLSRRHGDFKKQGGKIEYIPDAHTESFTIVMHDFNGWLPHLQYEQKEPMREVYRHVTKNVLQDLLDENGFLGLDTYFNLVCKPALRKALYNDDLIDVVNQLQNDNFGFLDFVAVMTEKHEYPDPFKGMQDELKEAQKAITKEQPIYWKEVIDDLMYTLNFHAELLSAEDHYIFNKEVMPFLLNVIAAMPLESAKIMLALHEKGKLSLKKGAVKILTLNSDDAKETCIEVENEKIAYKKFIVCSGQKSISLKNFPFQSLVQSGKIRAARSKVENIKKMYNLIENESQFNLIKNKKKWYLKLKGIDVSANFQLIDVAGKLVPNAYDLSFTHMSGLRPYSFGLQSCELTSRIVVEDVINSFTGK
ncbi:FAD/NAD(P)-binding protein [Cellulophaga sp. HaHaR_3_176]|uniref:FAD/NAD(P)-binding protein n=1 Tax=Cellulophaga sp. HaHaR_3_176 TaxID=1942464 RepID=UPI001C1F96F8|nr:FAD/NAD(P)-binding protein [Cellulophaga sp. HaHaR_3_176]QWX85011.1 FAD/NAD(P)-binding protein [Cellulophaga sp. HaHaR_3_176]